MVRSHIPCGLQCFRPTSTTDPFLHRLSGLPSEGGGVDYNAPSPTPLIVAAQTNSGTGDIIFGGTANFLRWTYRDADDTSRLVDDCNNPTTAMSPVTLVTVDESGNQIPVNSSRWRVNLGGYYYIPPDPATGHQAWTGEIDVSGQMVGIIRNISPFSVFDPNAIIWCEMSNQVTGVYNTFDLLPYSFDFNEPRFSPPMILN